MKFTVVISLLSVTALAVPLFEERQAVCNVPATFPTTSNSKLPNPFKFFDGRSVTTKADFECKNQEVSAALQAQELGVFPPKPSTVTASLSGNTLAITASEAGKSITFTISIQKPSGPGPFPAIIVYGAASLPIPNGGQNSRGQGKFYNLYGTDHSAGALTAWAWGVDRIIDALEITSSVSIDPKRVGVTGCSRNGKGAFVAAALVERTALGLPQESGAGGAACWRISDSEKAKGNNIQTASQIVGENVWFSPRFNAFSTKANTLAIDHHQLAGMVAPRGLLVIENEIDWLGLVSTTACMKAGRLIYKALGVPDNIGLTGSGNHNHCSFPANQQADLTAFISKFLLNQSTNTANIERGPSGADVGTYINWMTPTLT
ncbi:hypothetical protein EJ07DRAFT_168883 [Lizonia empirigonia]|nr:hypothetical protein EJ07DRAFT_168883 [Lizonia empirigonia]